MTLRFLAAVLLCAQLAGCAGPGIRHKDGHSSVRPFRIANIAKSEVDMVTEVVQKEALAGLRTLALKLYRRNPAEFRKVGLESAEEATERLFSALPTWTASEAMHSSWRDRFQMAFDETFAGDRVHAFVSALLVMTMASYDNRTEFFIMDSLDPQRLYNSARNVEVAAWKLAQARKSNGEPYLLSNSMDGGARNLSFEREIGKLVAGQDLLALVVEDKSNRAIVRVLQSTATSVFLPI